MKFRPIVLASFLFYGSLLHVSSGSAPEPFGPVTNEYDREIIAFFHFGINTFEDFVNEGDEKAPAAIFNPTALDCSQWIVRLKPVTACYARRRIADGNAMPALHTFGVYKQSEILK